MSTQPKNRAQALVQAYAELNATIAILHADATHCSEQLNEEGVQFWRRALVRAIFAHIEGVVYCMKKIAFSCRLQPGIIFSIGDLMILKEKSYRPNDKGEAEEQRMQLSFPNNIKFAFRTFALVHLTDYRLNVGDNRWDDLKKSLVVRDRLMHPKKVEDLETTDEEMERLQRAYDWFAQSTAEVMESGLNKMTEDAKTNRTQEKADELDRILDSVK